MTKNIAFKDVNQGTALGTLPLTPLVIEGLEDFKGSFDRLCLRAGTAAIERCCQRRCRAVVRPALRTPRQSGGSPASEFRSMSFGALFTPSKRMSWPPRKRR